MVAYGAFGLLVLTIRSFDGCFGRMPEQIRRSPFIAVVVAIAAGGIAIACAAGAIVTWADVRYQQSLSPEDLIGLISATIIVMTVLSLLPAVATVAAPIDGSAAAMAAVLKCWWRAARLGLAVALGPGLIAFALATARAAEEPILPSPVRLPNLLTLGPSILGHRLIDCVLLTATIFAQGAAIAALSIALYVWTRRRDVAIALGAGLFWVAAVMWPLILWCSGGVDLPRGLHLLSFLAVTISLAAELVTREPQFPALLAWATLRIAILALVTAGLLWRTVRAVDRNSSTA